MIKPIETVYNGYKFRSRLEARWAVFFDAMGVKWQYEPEGFELSDGTYYLPDFWLLNAQVFVEIKGQKPTEQELKKAKLLAIDSGFPVVVLCGMDFNFDDAHCRCFIFPESLADKQFGNFRCFVTHLARANLVAFANTLDLNRWPGYFVPAIFKFSVMDSKSYSEYLEAARQARFEHYKNREFIL